MSTHIIRGNPIHVFLPLVFLATCLTLHGLDNEILVCNAQMSTVRIKKDAALMMRDKEDELVLDCYLLIVAARFREDTRWCFAVRFESLFVPLDFNPRYSSVPVLAFDRPKPM